MEVSTRTGQSDTTMTSLTRSLRPSMCPLSPRSAVARRRRNFGRRPQKVCGSPRKRTKMSECLRIRPTYRESLRETATTAEFLRLRVMTIMTRGTLMLTLSMTPTWDRMMITTTTTTTTRGGRRQTTTW